MSDAEGPQQPHVVKETLCQTEAQNMEGPLHDPIGGSNNTSLTATMQGKVQRIDLTQLEDVSKDIVIPNILASLPPSLAQMVASSACRVQAFKAPSTAVQLVLPKSVSVVTTGKLPILPKQDGGLTSALAANSEPSSTVSVPASEAVNSCVNLCPSGKPVTIFAVAKQSCGPVITADFRPCCRNAWIADHDYIQRTRLDAKEALEKLDQRLAEVVKKTKRLQKVSSLVRRRYFKMKNFLKQLNELREAKNLPKLELKDDLSEVEGPQISDIVISDISVAGASHDVEL